MNNITLSKVLILPILFVSSFSLAIAKPIVNEVPLTLVQTKAFNFQSEVLNLPLNIKVTLPIGYKAENIERKYPIVYLTDGNLTGSMMGHSNIMQSFEYINPAPLPPVITVAMDFITDDFQDPDSTFEESIKLRANHFAPTKINDPYFGEIGGKADQFIEFLQTELIPFINSNYNVNTHDETFIGHSDGGLLSLYMLFSAPDSFDNYVAVSPSIAWDERVLFNYEIDYSNQYNDMNKNLYLALAINEDNTGEMFSDVKTMMETIKSRNYSSLNIKMQVFEDENHASVVVPAFTNGVRYALTTKKSRSLKGLYKHHDDH